MRGNPILRIFHGVAQSRMDLRRACEDLVSRTQSGCISPQDIESALAWCARRQEAGDLRRDAELVISLLVFEAARNCTRLDARARCQAAVNLWLAIPDGVDELRPLNAVAAQAALEDLPEDVADGLRAGLLASLGHSFIGLRMLVR